jgi:hypothetical protein
MKILKRVAAVALLVSGFAAAPETFVAAAPANEAPAASKPASPLKDRIFNKEGDCKGYMLPFSTLRKGGVLHVDLTGQENFTVSCSTSGCGSLFKSVEKPNLTIKISNMKVPGVAGVCTYSVAFRCAARTGAKGEVYVQGPVWVDGAGWGDSKTDRNCPDRDKVIKLQTYYFDRNNFYQSEAPYLAALKERRQAEERRQAAAEAERRDAFVNKMKAQGGPQAIYLFAGGRERDGGDSEARDTGGV